MGFEVGLDPTPGIVLGEHQTVFAERRSFHLDVGTLQIIPTQRRHAPRSASEPALGVTT
jgi:hypothetical protein